MSWRWITTAAFLAALVIGFGLLSDRNAGTAVPGGEISQPAYYLKDAVITETLPDGAPKYRLIAKRIDQQIANDSIALDSVRVDYLKAEQHPWFLSAQRGLVPSQSHIIQFFGDVRLRPGDSSASSQAPTFLSTEELTIDTERNVAYTTTAPVKMRFGHYTMTVRRLEADLNTEKVRMESVHGRSETG